MNKISTPLGILIIIVIALLVGGGILAYQYWWLPKQGTPPVTIDETAKITILSPNGGETWEIGKTYEIKWAKAENPDDTVTLFLNNDKIWSNPITIKSSVPNTGNYRWTIPQSLTDISGAEVTVEADNNYKILMQGAESGDSDFSDAPFSITAAATPGCSMKWWFDSSTTVCSQKQFCGTYMYYGLQTFDTQADCQAHLP